MGLIASVQKVTAQMWPNNGIQSHFKQINMQTLILVIIFIVAYATIEETYNHFKD
jgi:hypothetical protein